MNRTFLTLGFVMIAAVAAYAQAGGAKNKPIMDKTTTARGTFDVKTTPQQPDDAAAGPFSRLFLDKQFHGDLEAASKGQMMAAGTAVEGSGAYVALEKVSGSVGGKKGTFILMHTGTMRKNTDFVLNVTVVPDSGTEELSGIAGKMKIIIEKGKHSYEFTYSFAN